VICGDHFFGKQRYWTSKNKAGTDQTILPKGEGGADLSPKKGGTGDFSGTYNKGTNPPKNGTKAHEVEEISQKTSEHPEKLKIATRKTSVEIAALPKLAIFSQIGHQKESTPKGNQRLYLVNLRGFKRSVAKLLGGNHTCNLCGLRRAWWGGGGVGG